MREKLMRSHTAPHRDVQRATALVMAADWFANTRIAREVGVSPTPVLNWRERFREDGLKGSPGCAQVGARKSSIPAAKVEEIVRLTLQEKPAGGTH